jgi:hypothetical protein
MSGHNRVGDLVEFRILNVQVSSAHRAGEHAQQDLRSLWLGRFAVFGVKRFVRFLKNHRSHVWAFLHLATCGRACAAFFKSASL